MKESIKLIENQIRAYDTWLGEFEGHTMYNEIKSKRDALASDIEVLSNNSVSDNIIKNRPDIKDYFPKDTDVTDVVKSALDNPWYKYAAKLDRYIDELLEKMESSSRIIIAKQSEATVCQTCIKLGHPCLNCENYEAYKRNFNRQTG